VSALATGGTGVAAPALAARGIGWTVGGAVILDGIDVDVRPAELLAVIGPNGAGKSTLLHMLSGVRRPTSGRVELGGRDVTRVSAARRARLGMGRTFQTSSLFGGLAARENVRLAVQSRRPGALSPWRAARGEAELAEADRLLARVRMDHRAGSTAAELSHGDKRKLEIAVLLAMEPKVILLDEPMAGVARADVPGLSEVIRRMHRDHRCTVLMVEHHIDVVLGLVERVAVLHQGTILALDQPDAIMADPLVQSAYLGAAV
jgi:branched-chain amino acid transport system ATP-binding protein